VENFLLIEGFDKYLGVEATDFIEKLDARVPCVSAGSHIAPGKLQWVNGDHIDLRYRGNELKRRKIWAQEGDVRDGVLIYSYTGFTYPVALATSNWLHDEALAAMSASMNRFVKEVLEGPTMNHLIVTAYDSGSHNIGWHYDKARSIAPDSWIAILKLGPSSRRFALRKRAAAGEDQDKMPILYDEIVPAGTLILFDMNTNLATQHGVPVTEDETVGLSGSVVWRSITTKIDQDELKRRVQKTRKGREKRKRGA